MAMTASARVSKSRAHLLLDSPWFGSLAMRLQVIETTACETFSTNGTVLEYNPDFATTLNDSELKAVWAHEVMHCALQHPYRLGGRDLKVWNQACDYVVNSLLIANGFTLPDGALIDSQYDGLSAEQVYAKLAKQPQPNQPGAAKPKPNPTGDITQPQPTAADSSQTQPDQMTAQDWQIAAEQATAVSKRAGCEPGGAADAINVAKQGTADWREILRRFIENTVPSDYSWTAPNRRYLAAGLYLPGMIKENTPRIAVAIDTSGSITQELLDLFGRELTAILHETRPEALDVIYCDTAVRGCVSFSPDDFMISLSAPGRGGTRFQPAFDYVSERPEITPACLIYFTDLEGPQPSEPEYPVLWVTTESVTASGWFGETVRLSEFD